MTRASPALACIPLLTARGLLSLVLGVCAFPQYARPAASLNPSLSQLQHTSWTERDGAPPAINDIAQAPDGSLWLGSGEGLYRFDGFTFERVRAIDGDSRAPTEVHTLLATSKGSLWIGTAYSGAVLLRNGVAERFPKLEGIPLNTTVGDFAEDLDGTIWAGTPLGLQRFDGSQWRSVGMAWGLPETVRFAALQVDSSGTLWAEADGHRLFRLKRGARHFERLADFPQEALPFGQSPSGEYWASTSSGICPLAEVLNGTTASHCVAHNNDSAAASIPKYDILVFDRRGDLWMGSWPEAGIKRLDAATLRDAFRRGHPEGKAESFTKRDGLTSDAVRSIYRDRRDGSIWVGTEHGLDHFRKPSFLPALPEPAGADFGIQAQKDGRVWIGSGAVGGLWITSPEGKTERIAGSETSIQSLYETRRGTLWFATLSLSGVLSIASIRDARDEGKTISLPLTPELSSQTAVQSIVEDRAGAVWVSFLPYGLAKWDSNRWIHDGGLPGLPKAWVVILNLSPDGKLWAGYMNGEAARVDGTSVRTFSVKDGLDIGPVAAILSGASDCWLAGPNGLVRFDGQRFHMLLEAANRPFTGITGIAKARNGDLWLNAWDGVRRVAAAELREAEKNPGYAVHSDLYDLTDGLPSAPQRVRPFPTAVSSPDGRIWFGLRSGVVSVDPEDPSLSSPVPPVSIVRAIADGKTFDAANTKLAAGTKNLEIDYSAVSLNRASRVRFRYKLEGVDEGWRDVGSRRQAFYNDLPPGKYRFVVSASNGDDLWNEAGATMSLEVPAAFNQTNWFRALCVLGGVLGGGLAVWALARLRVRRVAAGVHGQLEARMAERERIARDLHDTLLQGVQGLLLRFQVAADRIPQGDPAREMIDRVLERADEVLDEGRARVKGLRAPVGGVPRLPQAVARIVEQLAPADASPFRITVEGAVRELDPIVREEAQMIAREALTNAFRHANAKNIEVEIAYTDNGLTVRVRDDGQGIDGAVLREGRPGHFGLLGMRERAKKINARLGIWSKTGAGTEVEIRVPASIAYRQVAHRARRKPWWRKAAAPDTEDTGS